MRLVRFSTEGRKIWRSSDAATDHPETGLPLHGWDSVAGAMPPVVQPLQFGGLGQRDAPAVAPRNAYSVTIQGENEGSRSRARQSAEQDPMAAMVVLGCPDLQLGTAFDGRTQCVLWIVGTGLMGAWADWQLYAGRRRISLH
jgi:hypothetical protein